MSTLLQVSISQVLNTSFVLIIVYADDKAAWYVHLVLVLFALCRVTQTRPTVHSLRFQLNRQGLAQTALTLMALNVVVPPLTYTAFFIQRKLMSCFARCRSTSNHLPENDVEQGWSDVHEAIRDSSGEQPKHCNAGAKRDDAETKHDAADAQCDTTGDAQAQGLTGEHPRGQVAVPWNVQLKDTLRNPNMAAALRGAMHRAKVVSHSKPRMGVWCVVPMRCVCMCDRQCDGVHRTCHLVCMVCGSTRLCFRYGRLVQTIANGLLFGLMLPSSLCLPLCTRVCLCHLRCPTRHALRHTFPPLFVSCFTGYMLSALALAVAYAQVRQGFAQVLMGQGRTQSAAVAMQVSVCDLRPMRVMLESASPVSLCCGA